MYVCIFKEIVIFFGQIKELLKWTNQKAVKVCWKPHLGECIVCPLELRLIGESCLNDVNMSMLFGKDHTEERKYSQHMLTDLMHRQIISLSLREIG